MAEPFIFISTTAVKEGKLEDYKKKFQAGVELAEANEPRLLHFALYVSEDGTEETTVQVHPDADSMASHMQLLGEKIGETREFLDFTKMRIQVYGTPGDAVLQMMRQIAGSGVRVDIKPQVSGFNRLQGV